MQIYSYEWVHQVGHDAFHKPQHGAMTQPRRNDVIKIPRRDQDEEGEEVVINQTESIKCERSAGVRTPDVSRVRSSGL